jgi:hypothetical protein
MAGQSIGLSHGMTRSVWQHEVEPGPVKRPPSLSSVQLLGSAEVLKVLVICPDLELARSTFQEVSPVLQCTDDRQHLLIMDLVIPLNQTETLGEEGDRMLFSNIFR